MLVNEEAIYDSKNTEPVYIILIHSGTLLSNIIKNVQGDEFSHSLISFNSKLDPMYSFGNKKVPTIGLNGDPGFVIQNTKDPFYKNKKSYYEVYVMFVSKSDKQKMIQRMKWFKEKDRYLGYDMIGLIKYKLGISSDNNLKKYFCSRFVAEIIGQSGKIDRDASLYSPQDFKDDFSFISLVNKGDDLYKYDYKLTEENLKKVKKGDYSYEKGTRFGHYLECSSNNDDSLLELSFTKKPSKYVNDDYDREKGIELDFKKNAGKDKELKYIAYYSFDGEDKWSTTSMGKDIVDSQMQQRLETFDQAMAKQILEAEDIVKAYNDWIEGQLDYIQSGVEKVKYTNKRTKQKYFQTEPVMDDPSGAIFAARYVQSLANDLGVDKWKVREFIKGTFFYTTDDPEEIRKLLEARLLYSQQTVQILTEVVDKNAEILGLTDKTAKSLIKKMNNDKTMNKGVAEIKKAIIKNRSKFLTNDGECIDLTSIGGGKIFFTGPAYKTVLTPYLRELEKTDPDIDDAYSALDMYFQKAMVYDCIVFAHGADFNNLQYLITSKLNKWALDKMDPDRRQYYSDLDTSNKTMDKNNKSGLIKKRWMMEPIRSDKSDYFNDMNSFVKQLLKEGHRKILIATCNPGNYALSPEVRDIAKRVKAKIIYSDYSTLIESYNYEDDDLRSIAESVGIDYDVVLDGENELRKLSESFDIDYDNLNEIVNINESDIIRNIKDYSKKILASIISVFKTGWNNIKNFIRFSGSKLSNSKEEIYTVKVGLIFPDERNIGVFTISSPIELRKWAIKSCDSIEYELKTLQSIQLQSIKDIMNFKDYNNESALLSESLNEFLMSGMTIDEALSMNEAKLASKERKALSDDEFGLPEKRKFPLNDKKHVLLAIKFFNRCDKKDQEELAKNIFKAMKKYDIPMDAIGKNNKLRNYMKESIKESAIEEMYPGNPIVGLNTEKEMIVDNMMNNAFTSLEIDEDIIEKCLRATTESLMNNMDNFYVPYIPYIQEHSNMDMNIGFYKDLNGIFVMNESTGLRSPSYKEVDDIDDRTILYITNGELNDSKLNDL